MRLIVLLLAFSNPVFNHGLAPPPSSARPFLVKRGWTRTTADNALMTQKKSSWTNHNNVVSMMGAISIAGAKKMRGCSIHGNNLMMVRGGGEIDDDDGADSNDDDGESSYEDEEYDTSDDDETDVEEEVGDGEEEVSDATTSDDETSQEQEPSPQEIERAQKYTQLSSQSRNFGIATALWGSLFFDAILNNAKRGDLFPASIFPSSSLSATMVPTVLLASGFWLASGLSFLLWRDLENRADRISSEDGTSGKGDWFLSLSSSSTSKTKNEINEEDSTSDKSAAEKFASQTRARLCLHLSIFGLINLGAHGGYYFSNQAPFLGASAAIINLHNTLACASALMKEEGAVKDWMRQALSWPLALFQNSKKGGGGGGKVSSSRSSSRGRLELTPFLFRLGAIVAWLRCIPTCRFIMTFISAAIVPGGKESAVIDNARDLSLKIASVARLTLFAGVSHTLYTAWTAAPDDGANKGTRNYSFRSHPFFALMSGMLGLACLSAGGTMLTDSFKTLSWAAVDMNLSTKIVAKGALVVICGLFAGYNSVQGFVSFKRKKEER